MDNKNKCLICEQEIIYLDEVRKLNCAICGKEAQSNTCCESGHYICDECHSSKGTELVTLVCKGTSSKNPLDIMNSLMNQPAIHMHGPEHHVLVGAALIAAYHNSGGDVELTDALDEMLRRGSQVPGGACGFWGACGAAVSTGIFISIITKATPLTVDSWGLCNLMTSKALKGIGEVGGPRCCKRNSFIATKAAVEFVSENFGINMELPEDTSCNFSHLNAQCKRKACPFYRLENNCE